MWKSACVALVILTAAPDRAPRPGEWGYRPRDGATVSVNPPSLTWVHDTRARFYEVQWSRDRAFRNPTGVRPVRWCAYTHYRPLKPGTYFWRYRLWYQGGNVSEWSRVRRFTVPADAVVFPQPRLETLRERIGRRHPRLFFRADELAALRSWAQHEGRAVLEALRADADRFIRRGPTPEPKVMGTIRNPETRAFWWPNREQTLRACREAETIALVYLMTGEERYGNAARRWLLHLASWDSDGPTNFSLNCEAAKPLLHRLPRVYDWIANDLSDSERRQVLAVIRRRALDAWRSWEVREGNGHLNAPYNSHGNRTWHKLGECAIATLGEIPEAETWLDYAVTKFYAAYPVWSDDDGGWHEGLSYWAGYMYKFVWWAEAARTSLGIDVFRKPYFSRVGDYALYTAPPGSPDMGFGDLSYRPPSARWSFVPYFAIRTNNPYLAWWADAWHMQLKTDDPLVRVLWARLRAINGKPPLNLPTSKVFRGTGVAVLNATLLDSASNVQIRFKSSPFGRQSHGHDPHNSFTLNAYGDQLLVNCVYRDWHGSPFHTRWCWSTRAHNAVLVDHRGQKPHSPDPYGRIVAWQFTRTIDYVAGEASAAYEGRLQKFLRHMLFVKPDLVLIVDELVATRPSTLQWMFHALGPFRLDERNRRVRVNRSNASLTIDLVCPADLGFRQWSGFEPPPDRKFMRGRTFPTHWHLEVSTTEPSRSAYQVAVLRPQRASASRDLPPVRVEWREDTLVVTVQRPGGENARVELARPNFTAGATGRSSERPFARVQLGAESTPIFVPRPADD